MDDAVDGIGMIATGAIVAREVERAHAPGHDHGGACANCGTVLAGPFCQACGQQGHVHRTVGALFHDIAHGVFHFEGRIWATLPMLVRSPGALTRRYVHGERTKFVSPMALFLFAVFLLFAVTSSITKHWTFGAGSDVKSSMTEERARLAGQVRKLETRARTQAAGKADADVRAETAADLAAARKDVADLDRAARVMDFDAGGKGFAGATGSHEVDSWLNHAAQNPKLLFYKMKTAAYKYSWALIPLSMPFIWMLFPFRRDVGMYDHAIFATYSLAFMMLLTIGLTLLSYAGVAAWMLWTTFVIAAPIHMYRQLKGAYRLGRIGAALRTFVLLGMTTIVGSLFFALLLYLGLAD